MNYILYFIRFIYKLRYWLVIVPLLVFLFMVFMTRNMARQYSVHCTVYTGIISGFNILSDNADQVSSTTQNSMIDNLLNIIHSDQTLKNVSLRLYARSLVYGNPDKDNMYIMASNYRMLYKHAIPEVRNLVDKSNENDSINEVNTYLNFRNYLKPDPRNYLYGLYNWNMPYFNNEALRKIEVTRDGRSDMLAISYTSGDPGLTLQTVNILCDEFINQYQELRFGETNKVVEYFEDEVSKAAALLRESEDELTQYNVEKRVVNYEEETEQLAYLNTQYELMYWDLQQTQNSAKKVIDGLEDRMGRNATVFKKNSTYLSYMNEISALTTRISEAELNAKDKNTEDKIAELQAKLSKTEKEFRDFIDNYGDTKYGQNGVANNDVAMEWISQLITYEKTEAELKVLESRKMDLDNKYSFFSPVGSTLKRKDRAVNINEQQYFSMLTALNAAKMRQKSLSMTSATLKVINPAEFPVSAEPTNRKKIVMAAYFASIIFILGFFLIIELLDRTLSNKMRAEKITGFKVLGAYPRRSILKFRSFFDIDCDVCSKMLGNELLNYSSGKTPIIINILSTKTLDGKSFVGHALFEYWQHMGMNVKYLNQEDMLNVRERTFMNGTSIKNFVKEAENLDILLVEYPAAIESNVPQTYLKEANINVVVVDSRRLWRDTDQAYLDTYKKLAEDAPIRLLLTQAKREEVESFTGLLQPYTFTRRLVSRMLQFGLTAIDKH